ncbi:hypothetical protein IAQ61_007127, partial [Plenodomus lingam]|uniref:uncharacterized protein n=1 Tax=Leptosphaeria maculans TaxID=5022 RepID=UPI003317ED7D
AFDVIYDRPVWGRNTLASSLVFHSKPHRPGFEDAGVRIVLYETDTVNVCTMSMHILEPSGKGNCWSSSSLVTVKDAGSQLTSTLLRLEHQHFDILDFQFEQLCPMIVVQLGRTASPHYLKLQKIECCICIRIVIHADSDGVQGQAPSQVRDEPVFFHESVPSAAGAPVKTAANVQGGCGVDTSQKGDILEERPTRLDREHRVHNIVISAPLSSATTERAREFPVVRREPDESNSLLSLVLVSWLTLKGTCLGAIETLSRV